MEITVAQAQELVTQVQTAHRLAVGFYQRLLPLLTRIASELDVQFWYWEPAHTSRPSPSTTSPNSGWKWDLVPLFASRHVFWRIAGEQAQPGDTAIVFNLYLDEDFKPSRRKKLGIAGEPDPLKLQGSAAMIIHAYRCTADNGETFRKMWNDAEWPTEGVEGWHKVSPTMDAWRCHYPLAQFIAEPENVVAEIREALAEASTESA
ncbi:hypothetical protein LLG90_08335 [Aromatoleum toluclasticum]|uniref:hypothetical protein n=1 Tax=Aromatoleum toluclasticum TaxID=92003 RepID=UPI001D188553|nr:hypothetical protein [Aromatoleum toluclasticum]MCC4115352.1 hypothetical protein [Aromatoleum toluclasticum]